jgi:hypothetical protein
MIRTAPTPAPKVKTLEQQNTDFTSEGSPPPGMAGTSIPAKVTPVLPVAAAAAGKRKSVAARAPLAVPRESAPALPHERDESVDTTGTIPSEPMQQAYRDIKRGLKDTDRGAEAGRTYKKLKQKQ